jgi:2-phospho-L-lactate guanylyltransferase
MRVVVPFAVDQPKTRLSAPLGADERRAFARAMLADVLAAIDATGHDSTVLATAELDADAFADLPGDASVTLPADTDVVVDDRSLSTAVNDVLATADDPVGVLMSDLPLVKPETVRRLAAKSGDVVAAPGRGGGTNALVVRHADFRVDYHGASYLDHRAAARDVGATFGTVDSFRLATDVDEPSDLAEVLIHGDGAAADWLVDAGFRLAVDEGRVGVAREEERS